MYLGRPRVHGRPLVPSLWRRAGLPQYPETVTDIDRYKWSLSMQLLVWALLSIAAGVTMFLTREGPFFRGAAVQFVIWGGVNLVLSLVGARSAWRGAQGEPDEYRVIRETVRLRRILRINARLDVLYCLVGLILIGLFPGGSAAGGHGTGVFVQGLFLLVFDAIHAGRLPSEPPPWYDPAV